MFDVHEVLETDSPLILLDTNASQEVLAQLRQIALREGRIIYHWKFRHGLHPVGDPTMHTPGTESLGSALKTLQSQPYTSLCVIDDVEGMDFGLLQQHSWNARSNEKPGFAILLLLPEHSIPEGLLRMLQVKHWQKQEAPKPRLRNGQWLL